MNKSQFCDVILKCVLEFNFPTDTRELFAKLRSNSDLIDFINIYSDQYQNKYNNLLVDNIARVYVQNNKLFHPNFLFKIHREILDFETSFLFLNLHTNISPLAKLVLEKNHSVYILSDFQGDVLNMTHYSGILKGDIRIFPRDSNSLLYSKRLLSSSKIVSATIDFRVKMPGIFNYLSDSMLRLAYLIKPKTFFGVANTDDCGNVEYKTYKINFSISIEETKQEILKFIQELRGPHLYKWNKFDHEGQNKMIQEYLASVHN